MKFVVNADDFGLRKDVNAAIVQCFSNGWISSATLMVNMPGFLDACRLIDEHSLRGRVGLHLNLATGRPLSSAITQQTRLCGDDGMLRLRMREGLWLSKEERAAVADELRAQWRACLDNGVQPTHLDSHHHTHLGWAVGGVVIALAAELGIPAVRIYWNVVPSRNVMKRFYIRAVNWRFRKAGLMATPFMAHAMDGARAVRERKGPLEIMVHPQLAEDGTITNYRGGSPFREVFESFGLSDPPVSFGDLARQEKSPSLEI